MTEDNLSVMALTATVIAGLIIIGLAIDWWRRYVDRTWRSRAYRPEPTTPEMSMAETRAWNRRLALLHEIDDGYGSSCRVIRPGGVRVH